ncbi:DUF945 domain-containing protein [Rodentibacter caecimuris]|uniref:YdgA family protein n=1 Tax=Rodentibacter caecimuris TaxID=1796644 RepID=UPI0010942EDD|nr:YdgA family protein [Pasteurella caecimuris]MCR1836368.1 YdgA family protein [Pasteurella caecimuris]MCU0105881.1 YdgA family protein [Pasteurella caecimuris]TGY50397.1 DUF945 domain-containing protein [Pasteurella caecimuris]
MKKSKIAIGVIAVLGAAWVGGTWFTGQTAESEYKRQIELNNQKFRALGGSDSFNVEFKNKQFERGFFSSQVEDEIVISLAKEEKQWIIPFSSTLYHGPLPLNQLIKFNFMPAMFAVEGTVGKNEMTQLLFDITKSDKPIQYQAATSYALATKGILKVLGGEFIDPKSAKNKLAWSDVDIDFDVNKDLSGQYDASVSNITFDLVGNAEAENHTDENNFESEKFHWKGIKFSTTFAPTKWSYLYTGKGTSSIDSIEMTSLDKNGTTMSVVEKGVKSTSEVNLEGDFLSLKATNNIDALIIDNKDLGKIAYNIELNHFEANAINALFESLISVLKEGNTGGVNQIIEVWAKQYGMAIFNNQPQIKLNPISISDNQGKVALDMNIALAKDPKLDVMHGHLYKQFTDFVVDIQVDKATAENLMTKFFPEEDKASIKAKIEEMAAEVVSKGIAVNNEKSVTMKLVLENGELKLNGQSVPEEQVVSVIFMLLMGAAMQH